MRGDDRNEFPITKRVVFGSREVPVHGVAERFRSGRIPTAGDGRLSNEHYDLPTRQAADRRFLPVTTIASPAAVNQDAAAPFTSCRSDIVEFFMPAQFTRTQVTAIAALAQLELSEGEIEMFARQLGDILAYADEVQQIDTSGVPPTASVLARLPVDRPDEVRPSLSPAEALANAPDPALAAGLFRVPRVIG
jgi:aspartyl-tRNA(Asn)/glutamyl-tRNA(Gln) amidotransferase subunit C